MRLESVYFSDSEEYQRMKKVLSYTAKLNSPNTPLTLRDFPDDAKLRIKYSRAGCHKINNALKTKYHKDIVLESKAGELIGLLDCDMMVLGDLSELENEDFDFAYTVRPDRWPINSGAVFVRVSEKTKWWYDQWWKNVFGLLQNSKTRNRYQIKYGGINQCGLAMLLESKHDLKLLKLPCSIWNSVPVTFETFQMDTTKIVHILGILRNSVFNNRGTSPKIRELTNLWHRYEKESKNVCIS